MIFKAKARGENLDESAFNVEATSFVLAGSHTTSNSLTWIVWRIVKDPEVQRKLTKELREYLSDTATVPSFEAVRQLPYLNAVVKEGLR
jgi:benzoate 4-monooxygenase